MHVAAKATAQSARPDKDAAREKALGLVRPMVRRIQATATVTNAERDALGITIPDGKKERQRPGVRGEGDPGVAGEDGVRDDLRPVRQPVGEPVYRELHREAEGRVPESGRFSERPGGAADLCGVAEEYDFHRPHSSLGYLTPKEFAKVPESSARATPSAHFQTAAREDTLSL